ncbi:TraB/GumN family protein [Fibrobacterales bacterium]|nr:TraB/GumN family protein [Fibrobacterales bacterium]
MKIKTLLLIPSFLLSFSYAASPLWKVSDGISTLYIGGTVHLLGTNDYPLPDAFSIAYKNSQKLVFETDLTQMENPATQALMMQKMMLPPGQTLKTVLTPSTYQKLHDYMTLKGIPIEMMHGFKPAMISVTLSMMEIQKMGQGGTGVDKFYQLQAIQDKKNGQLEKVEEQIEFIASMGKGQEDEFIIYTLRDLKILPQMLTDIKKAWRVGDLKQLTEIGISPLKNEFPDIYKTLMTDRNSAWMPQILDMFKDTQTELVLVGALHLAGSDGLIAQLKSKGFSVKQMD